ncbi:MAG: radical SAM family heme chaperone HemW [Helicobacteraceae bacterium]|nr:radical SAM family heme chaperone HemW [Helicobacteraceae bacterium]
MIYLHVPFCETKCPYCAFNSFTAPLVEAQSYVSAVLRQLENDIGLYNFRHADSLYIGGGTPSMLAAKLYKPFFEALKGVLTGEAEITVEANPASLVKEWAEGMAELGANRISIGVQSFDDRKLKRLGRTHTAQEAIEAIGIAKSAGFEEISVDFIYAVKGDTLNLLLNDLRIAAELGVTHISAYQLTVENNRALQKIDRNLEKRFSLAIDVAGYPRYEVSNYGKKPSRHNAGYWNGLEYLGLGAGATGTARADDGWIRYEPLKSIGAYIADPRAKTIEKISQIIYNSERLMLGLRCNEGFERSRLTVEQLKRAKFLLAGGKLMARGDRLYNTDLWIGDEIWLYLNQ